MIGRNGVVRLFEHADRIPFVSEVLEEGKSLLVFAPRHRVLGAESGFVEIFVIGGSGETGEVSVFDACGVGGPKDGSHVVDGPDVVDDDPDGVLRELVHLVGVRSFDFIPTQLAHVMANEDVWTEDSKSRGGSGVAIRFPSRCFSPYTEWNMRNEPGIQWLRPLVLILVCGLLVSCQTLREVSNLRDVQFRIDRATDARLAGIDLAGLESYRDLSGADVARLGASLSQGDLPFSFTLHVEAENPADNSVDARLTEMDWTLLLNEQETISGVFDREVVLSPGTPKDVPVDIELDLVEFFDENLRGMVELATAVGGEGPPTNVQLRVQPTVQTRLGPMKYPNPITVVSKDVGASASQ